MKIRKAIAMFMVVLLSLAIVQTALGASVISPQADTIAIKDANGSPVNVDIQEVTQEQKEEVLEQIAANLGTDLIASADVKIAMWDLTLNQNAAYPLKLQMLVSGLKVGDTVIGFLYSNGKFEQVETRVLADGLIEADIPHFSIFGLVIQPALSSGTDVTSPKTGAAFYSDTALLITLVSLCAMLFSLAALLHSKRIRS